MGANNKVWRYPGRDKAGLPGERNRHFRVRYANSRRVRCSPFVPYRRFVVIVSFDFWLYRSRMMLFETYVQMSEASRVAMVRILGMKMHERCLQRRGKEPSRRERCS